MSDRERWVVYPLLFMALGFSLRSRFTGPEDVQFKRVQCESVDVVDKSGRRYIALGDGRLASQKNEANAPSYGTIEVFDVNGVQRVALAAGPYGGELFLHDNEEKLTLVLGHEVKHSGLIFLRAIDDGKGTTPIRAILDRSEIPPPPKPEPPMPDAPDNESDTSETPNPSDTPANTPDDPDADPTEAESTGQATP